ncbi:MAG: right-handed parallel beta-helix repeat-containing protein [Gaiellaceae bacterium]
MRSRRATGAAVLAGLALTASLVTSPASPAAPRSEIHVPDDVPTLQQAIARAQPGDTIVLAPGTYPGGNVVPPAKNDITIRGVDRNEVVLDGANQRRHGIVVHADGVSILNLSAHDFLLNGLYWEGADRYRASYVTIWNVGGYGIYAEDGEEGVVDHAYVSGAADAAYYVGECRPCRATIENVVGALSAVGYSGTNATGVLIRDSLWDRNGAGILPNTYENEALAPQSRTTILRNTVTNSGRARVPIRTPLAGFIGIGIAVAGGNANAISRNRVSRSQRYGIAIFPTARFVVFDPNTPEPGPPWRPRGNRVARNVVTGSGRADLALARGSGTGNCFSRNVAARSLPRGLQSPTCAGVSAVGDAAVAADLTRPVRVMVEQTMRRRDPPVYSSMPTPPQQPTMP